MASQGYVRYPAIHQDRIAFVSEDDLWLVSSEGGRAERLTAGVGEVSYPRFSPDGTLLAFVGQEEGPGEVYVMPAAGDMARRLTYQGVSCRVSGWMPDGAEILYASSAGQFNWSFEVLFAITPDGGEPRQLPFGLANAISFGPRGEVVLGRNIREPARWKRYRGGTVGHLWCDINGGGTFERLLRLDGNIADPCWIGERIYFLSDHEGVGNVYSCTPEGEDVRRHTQHEDFYARQMSGDGQRLVYQAGAALYIFDPAHDAGRRLDAELPSIRTQRNRKFVSAGNFLNEYRLHPEGYALAITTRGKAFTMGNWEGPTLQHGELDGVRYRHLNWLNDGKRLVAISDAPGRESLMVFHPEEASEAQTLPDIEFGRVISLAVSPSDDVVALSNHRNELIMVDLESASMRVLDRSDFGEFAGFDWSPDGRWLAYGFTISNQKTAIKLCNLETGENYFVTEPLLRDYGPAFDPDGKYLYFLGERILNPVHDSLQFDLNFPQGVKPYVITLQKDLRSPFMPEPKAPSDKDKDKENGKKGKEQEERPEENDTKQNGADETDIDAEKPEKPDKKPPEIVIDLDGITRRALPFPVPEGRYYGVSGIKGKALFLVYPVQGAIHEPGEDSEPKGHIDSFDFEKQKYEMLITKVSGFDLSRDYKYLIYRSHHRLRVLKAGEKPPRTDNERTGRESGWVDLNRIKVSVQPAAEWKQMFAEAWRLQREHFWTEDMSGIDWEKMYAQYAPLLARVSSRRELSDLLWELQGELGTSHAYESGGEYRARPYYRQGFLGVDWRYDAESQRYRIAHIITGDTSDSKATSPLTGPGLNVNEGDAVLAINGQRVKEGRSPQELLVNQAGNEVQLTIEDAASKETRVVTVKALAYEMPARYREWVEHNRAVVHEKSGGKVGYIHIPDMSSEGYAEFHRSYLAEYDYEALLVDVRYNGGGNVSGLLLEKLARRRVGYKFRRWGQPRPYPYESPRGPMVALTNEHAGSDGDIFSHSFKLMGLGPLIGKRTWGGVIGITYHHKLVDGTRTTQPEFASWFRDVGWNVENYGTDPDIEVDIAPHDFARGDDPQLDRAIVEALRMIEEKPSLEPRTEERPRKTWR